jgi:hypothetical protein
MIGGIIVLSLFLTALVAMVVVSQQYDAYQNTVKAMSRMDIDRLSENVTAINPGLAGSSAVTGCGSSCNQYNMSLSNVGGVGVQIVRVYINSTGSGCTQAVGYCILGASSASSPAAYTFKISEGFLNAGEFNHTVRLWLPSTITLPNPNLVPSNTIWIVTARGRVFTFQWPFPPVGPAGGQGTNPTIQTGLMKIAYNSTNYNSATDSCHNLEKSKETWSVGGSKTLTFVNPWISNNALSDVMSQSPPALFVYANTINSFDYSITINWGNIILILADSSPNQKQFFIGGPLAGIVYPITPAPGTFTPAGNYVTIKPGDQFIMIFRMTRYSGWSAGQSFSGTATVNNQKMDSNFRAFSIYLDGLYVRSAC